MLYLIEGQEVELFLEDGSIYSNVQQQICFNGIFYDPSSPDPDNRMTQVAWSVQRNSSDTAPDSDKQLTFDSVEVNSGLAYNETTDEVVIPVDGYYFLQVSAGALATLPVRMMLMRNGVQQAALRRDSTVHNGIDTLGRSVLALLSKGDVVTIEIGSGSGVYSDVNHQTSFTGFLIVNR